MEKQIYIKIYSAIIFTGILSWSCNTATNEPENTKQNNDCMFSVEMTLSNASETYIKNNSNEYIIESGAGEMDIKFKMPNRETETLNEDFFDPTELPDTNIGEYQKWGIVELSENNVYMQYSEYDSELPLMNYEILEFYFSDSSLNDYYEGKKIKLKLTSKGMESYIKNQKMEMTDVLADLFDPIEQNTTCNNSDLTLLLSNHELKVIFGNGMSISSSGTFNEELCKDFY